MDNRRQYPRFSFSEPVGYKRGSQNPLEGSLAEDISQTGLKLTVNEFIALNTVLELQIKLPGQVQLVPAHAKVVWVKQSTNREDGWELGLNLISSESFSSAIRNYVSYHQFGSLS